MFACDERWCLLWPTPGADIPCTTIGYRSYAIPRCQSIRDTKSRLANEANQDSQGKPHHQGTSRESLRSAWGNPFQPVADVVAWGSPSRNPSIAAFVWIPPLFNHWNMNPRIASFINFQNLVFLPQWYNSLKYESITFIRRYLIFNPSAFA